MLFRSAEVWAQMSGAEALAPDVVEKRLNMILPKLAAVTDTREPPVWWPPLRPQLKVWTTARRFEPPASVYAPDDAFAEEVFANTARIAWVPKSHGALRLNRLLRSLGEPFSRRKSQKSSGKSNRRAIER